MLDLTALTSKISNKEANFPNVSLSYFYLIEKTQKDDGVFLKIYNNRIKMKRLENTGISRIVAII